MPLLSGLHHMTFLTGDMDRLISFYERVFDAVVTFDRTEQDPPRRRHALSRSAPTPFSTLSRSTGSTRRRGSRSSRAGAWTTSRSTRQARKHSSRFAAA
jgi:catechol 2,3-dioxygenase-like lactoylglutathione lyase family enzyme